MEKIEELYNKAAKYITTALKDHIEIENLIRKIDIGNKELQQLKENRWILEWRVNETWYLGLSKGWESVLSHIVFGTENENGLEVAVDLVKEFVNNLIHDMVRTGEAIKKNKKEEEITVIKPSQIPDEFKLKAYSFLQIVVEGQADFENKEKIRLVILIAIPPQLRGNGMVESQVKKGTDMIENDSINGKKVEFEEFSNDKLNIEGAEDRNIEILKDVEMNISVVLGRKELPLGEILQLVKGSVVALDKMAGEPVEVLVNGSPIAQGEVVVIDEHFGVRITGLVSERERMKSLN